MITKLKQGGFFIVEILIVLLLVAILVIVLLPYYNQYTARAQFQNLISVGNAAKSAVEVCAVKNTLSTCNNSNNVPSAQLTNSGGVVGSYVLKTEVLGNGVITVTSPAAAAGSIPANSTYTLTPTNIAAMGGGTTATDATGGLTWSGACVPSGLC